MALPALRLEELPFRIIEGGKAPQEPNLPLQPDLPEYIPHSRFRIIEGGKSPVKPIPSNYPTFVPTSTIDPTIEAKAPHIRVIEKARRHKENGPSVSPVKSPKSDSLNNVIGLIDQDGNTVMTCVYDAWGSMEAFDNSGNVITPFDDIPDALIPHASMFGYRNQLHDLATGEIYMRHRQVIPELGIFTTPDPLGENGGTYGLYSYVSGDPVQWQDFSGLSAIEDTLRGMYADRNARVSQSFNEMGEFALDGLQMAWMLIKAATPFRGYNPEREALVHAASNPSQTGQLMLDNMTQSFQSGQGGTKMALSFMFAGLPSVLKMPDVGAFTYKPVLKGLDKGRGYLFDKPTVIPQGLNRKNFYKQLNDAIDYHGLSVDKKLLRKKYRQGETLSFGPSRYDLANARFNQSLFELYQSDNPWLGMLSQVAKGDYFHPFTNTNRLFGTAWESGSHLVSIGGKKYRADEISNLMFYLYFATKTAQDHGQLDTNFYMPGLPNPFDD